ncbi:hypothetical protein GQS40_06955|uniref:Uncharacterized protein n=1 Tax=Leuconostoc lactis TaxID=1246 RepID=A0A6L7A706_LEULA|nr:hypothetical protein [Leuconostoc lactis]
MFKSDRDVRWQFTIDINAIQKVLNHDIAQNATITLINPGLFEGEETIRYAGAPTGANVGIFADKNSIYVDLAVGSIGDEKQGASNKWSGYDYRQGYSLIVDGEMINFTLGDLGQSGNFHVLNNKC